MERLGPVGRVLAAGRGAPLPRPIRNQQAPAISGQQTSALDASVGLSFLAAILGAFCGAPVGIEGAYRRTARVVFSFDEVLEDAVSLVDLDRYLSHARVADAGHVVGRLLEADDLYVTTAVVKSRRFSIVATTASGAEAAVNLPMAQALVAGHVRIRPAATGSGRLDYRGRAALGFGFRAVRLFFSGGRFSAFRPLAPGDAALSRGSDVAAAGGASGPDWLVPGQAFARLR
jgi:hypothetical protein